VDVVGFSEVMLSVSVVLLHAVRTAAEIK